VQTIKGPLSCVAAEPCPETLTIAFFALRRFKKTKSTDTRRRTGLAERREAGENTKTAHGDSTCPERKGMHLLPNPMIAICFPEFSGQTLVMQTLVIWLRREGFADSSSSSISHFQ
jgi:hypothetical protein